MPWFKVLNPRGILNSGKKMINRIKVEKVTVAKQAWENCVDTVETELQPYQIEFTMTLVKKIAHDT